MTGHLLKFVLSYYEVTQLHLIYFKVGVFFFFFLIIGVSLLRTTLRIQQRVKKRRTDISSDFFIL